MLSSILIEMKCWSSWIQMSAFLSIESLHTSSLYCVTKTISASILLSLCLSLSVSCYLTNTLTKTHLNCLSLSVPLVCNKDRSTSTNRQHSNLISLFTRFIIDWSTHCPIFFRKQVTNKPVVAPHVVWYGYSSPFLLSNISKILGSQPVRDEFYWKTKRKTKNGQKIRTKRT